MGTRKVFVDFDGIGLPSVLTNTQLSPDRIGGISLGNVNADYPWRNAPHYVRLNLQIANGQIKGQVEFRSFGPLDQTSAYSYYSMSHWVEFEKRDENLISNK